jgi:hypothetical protein
MAAAARGRKKERRRSVGRFRRILSEMQERLPSGFWYNVTHDE